MLTGLRSPMRWRSAWPNGTYWFYPDSEGQSYALSGNDTDYWTVTASPVDGVYWGFSPEGDTSGVRWPIGILLTALTILIALGNSLVVLAVFVERQLRTFENVFFASLAVADLSIALFVLPLTLSVELSDGHWHFGRTACGFFIFVDVSCCTASILHLCTIGLNRYWSIASPLRHATRQTNRRACLTIVSVWLLSFIIASPPIFGWPKRTNNVSDQCTYDEDRLYVVCSATGSFYLPLIVMIMVYYKIYRLSKKGAQFRRTLPARTAENKAGNSPTSPRQWGSHRSEPDFSDRSRDSTRPHIGAGSSCELMRAPGSTTDRPRLADREHRRLWSLVCRAVTKRREKKSGMRLAEVKTAKTLGLIMTVFVVCWLPFFLLYVIKPFCPRCRIPVALDRSALWLGYANSLLNPIIYICCKPLFRRTFKKILLLDYCRLTRRYSFQVQCCPARPHWHRASRCRRRRHVVGSDSSYSYRAEYGHLNANVPPEILHEEDRTYRESPNTSQGPSCERCLSASERDGAWHSGSSNIPASVDWSSASGGVIKRVPNACVTDIPRSPPSSRADDGPDHPQDRDTGPGGWIPPPGRAGDPWWHHHHHHGGSSTLPRIAPDLDGEHTGEQRWPRPLASFPSPYSDLSPRVRVINRRGTSPDEPTRRASHSCDLRWSNRATCSKTHSSEEDIAGCHLPNSPDRVHQELPLATSEGVGSTPALVKSLETTNGNGEGNHRPRDGGIATEMKGVIEANVHVGTCTGVNETTL